jgi:hypothetical protein
MWACVAVRLSLVRTQQRAAVAHRHYSPQRARGAADVLGGPERGDHHVSRARQWAVGTPALAFSTPCIFRSPSYQQDSWNRNGSCWQCPFSGRASGSRFLSAVS